MYVFRRFGLRFGESFYEKPDAPARNIDILRTTTTEAPSGPDGVRQSDTLEVDLGESEELLLAAMHKNTRYEIRRAIERDDFEFRVDAAGSRESIRRFADYYDRFAATKGRRPMARPRLLALGDAHLLVLTSVIDPSAGDTLVYHAYIRAPHRAMLLYSASLFRESSDAAGRARIGRANRFAHWQDIRTFKGEGVAIYDLGGIDLHGRSEETSRIADFKRGFGGRLAQVYSVTEGVSVLGRVALALARGRI